MNRQDDVSEQDLYVPALLHLSWSLP